MPHAMQVKGSTGVLFRGECIEKRVKGFAGMKTLRTVLTEELRRLKRLSRNCAKEIDKLPKGYISIKRIAGHRYAYLAFREKDKVCTKYIGKAGSGEAKEMKRQIKERRSYESRLKMAVEDILDLKEVILKIRGRRR